MAMRKKVNHRSLVKMLMMKKMKKVTTMDRNGWLCSAMGERKNAPREAE